MPPVAYTVRLTSASCGHLPAKFLNRHGLIAGATGSGKTVTLMRLAEECGALAIPVILTDVKGDAARLLGSTRRLLPFQRVFASHMPTPLQALGSDVFARMIGASPAQVAALWALIEDSHIDTIGDLIEAVEKSAPGVVSVGTKQALARYLRPFERNAAFGRAKAGDMRQLLTLNAVSILDVQRLAADPASYGAVMTWLLRSAFEHLPEVGDLDRPKLVLIIDEAHTLFRRMNAETLEEFARVMRLIRSRGVGVFFATQDPTDIPIEVSQHLATRVIHSMRPGNPRLAPYVRSLYRGEGFAPERLYALRPGEALIGGVGPEGQSVPMDFATVLKPAVPLNAPLPEPEPEPLPGEAPATSPPRSPAKEFGRRKPPASVREALAESQQDVAQQVEDAGLRASMTTAALLCIVSALLTMFGWHVLPSSDTPMSAMTLARGGAGFFFFGSGLLCGALTLYFTPAVLRFWKMSR